MSGFLLNPFVLAGEEDEPPGPPADPTSTQWRVRVTDGWLGTDKIGCVNLEMHDTVSSADLTAGQTAAASATFSSFVAANAIDSSTGTLWTTGTNTAPGGGHWIKVTFGSPVTIKMVSWRCRGDGFREDPKDMQIEYFDGSAWQLYWSVSAIPVWRPGETRTYAHSDIAFPALAAGAHRYWRIDWLTCSDGMVLFRELELRIAISGADVTGSGTASGTAGFFSGTEGPDKAFDNSEATLYQPACPGNLVYDFGSGNDKAIVELVCLPHESFPNRTPDTFKIGYSDNGSAWTDVATYAPNNTWGEGCKNFRLVAMPALNDCVYAP